MGDPAERLQKGAKSILSDDGPHIFPLDMALKAKGIRCVIAKSFARIFFRNAFNVGLPLVESPEAAETIEQGHRIAVDLKKGEIRDLSTGRVYRFESIPEHMMRILEHGGLIPFLAQKRRSR